MHTTFHVDFWGDHDGGHLGYARLEVDLPFAPSTDMEFEHPVWHEGRKGFVSFNIEEGSFYVALDRDKIPADHLKQHAEMYKLHGWTLSAGLERMVGG